MVEFPEIEHAHGGDREWRNTLPDPVLASLQVHVLCAFRWVFHRGWDFRNVSEAFSRLYLVESGGGVIEHHGRRYQLSADHLYLIPAHAVHSHTTEQRLTMSWAHFTAVLQAGVDLFDYLPCDYAIPSQDVARDRSLFSQLCKACKRCGAGAAIERASLMLQLLVPFLQTVSEETLTYRRREHMRFQPVLNFIHENLTHRMYAPQLAKVAHLEPSYFSRVFRQHFGVPPVRYILQRRIQKAQQLLLQTDEPVGAIAVQVGILDIFHFSATFRRITGMSPTAYRSWCRGQRTS